MTGGTTRPGSDPLTLPPGGSQVRIHAAGAPVLLGVGAPTSLAVRVAREMGMTIAGFARGDRVNVYSGAERVVS